MSPTRRLFASAAAALARPPESDGSRGVFRPQRVAIFADGFGLVFALHVACEQRKIDIGQHVASLRGRIALFSEPKDADLTRDWGALSARSGSRGSGRR